MMRVENLRVVKRCSNMQSYPKPSLSFRKTSKDGFSPRLGYLVLTRECNQEKHSIEIPTPGILVSAPRGVVPHLSRDHVQKTASIKWLNVPLETLYVPLAVKVSSQICQAE